MLIMTTLAALAFASPIDSQDTMGTRYAELRERFKAAAPARAEDVVGWTTGRCYKATAPDRPIGALLVNESRPSDGREGPDFDHPITKGFFLVANPHSLNDPT